MLYLCCLFSPGKDFYYKNIDYYAERSEWIEAKNGKEAVKIYRERHAYMTRGEASPFVKALSMQEDGHTDGENGYKEAMRIIIEYYSATNFLTK